MKVLFVLSGNKDKTSGLVANQAQSILQADPAINIDYFYVKGKGLSGYLKNRKPLRQKIKEFDPALIHAHYSFCGFLAALTFSGKPIVTSLMGSDLHLRFSWRFILFFASFFWKAIIVKSQGMKKNYLAAKTYVIPNGVDLSKYPSLEKKEARHKLGLDQEKTYVLFLADPKRKEKNVELAKQAFQQLNMENAELLIVHDIPHDQTRLYYYAVDILVLTSLYEGSPNVVKEAMVCNCPVVSTDVGDIKILFETVEGNYMAGFDVSSFSEKLKQALVFSKQYHRTKGRAKIVSLGINADHIAAKIISVYKSVA
jgi:glycosyltransferase involved in cell wall biosynthesis